MTKDEILKIPAGRELDALIAEYVMYLNVVSKNHPCGNQPDGGYEPSSFIPPASNFYDKEDVVYLPEGYGIYPPQKTDMGDYYCIVEIVPFYSTNIADAWEVVETLREHQTPIQIRGDEWYDGGGWIVEVMDILGEKVMYESYIGVSGPNRGRPNICLAICRAALLATRRIRNE